jgi:predicted permease
MSLVRHALRGLQRLMHPAQADANITADIEHYLAQARTEFIAAGMTPDEATAMARREVGNVTGVHEQVRGAGWEQVVETVVLDVRVALRRLRNAPAFTIAAATTLAIGIGASTAVFSAVAPILLEPLPFPHAAQLVTVMDRSPAGDANPPTLGSFQELRARSRSFATMAATDRWLPSLTQGGDLEQLEGQRVTAGYFQLFGAAPLLGRAFTSADDRPGGPRMVMISAALWQRRFGGDRSIVGRSVDVDGIPSLVVGIMPATFANVLSPNVQVWAPMQETATADFASRAWGHHYQVVARLRPGATIDAATRETRTIGRTPLIAFPRPRWADMADGMVVRTLQDHIAGSVKPALFAIMGAVALLLLIASVNVTNLLLARGARRRPELAMRVALGAGRVRLLRQLLTESVVLALAGGVLGLGVARIGLDALLAASPPGLPRIDAIHLDGTAFVFALALTTLVGLIVGLVPAVRTLHADVTDGLRPGTRRSTAGKDSARGALVVVEVALALMLLVSAGLLLRSVRRLVSVPPGFDASHVMTMQVIAVGHEFRSDTARLQFLQQSLDAVRRVPGVSSAAFTSQLPLSGEVDGYGYEWQSLPSTRNGQDGSALRYEVTPDYFSAMHIALRRGRLLDASDRPGHGEAIIINASLSRRLFGDRDPIGERVRFGPEMGGDRPWDDVVGVVGDVRQYSLAVPAPDAFYVVAGQWDWVDNTVTLVVRARGETVPLVPALKRAIWSVNAAVPIQRIRTMDALVAASAGQRQFVLLAIEVFAVAALLLAAVGLYGVISGGVTERLREIGIRSALGASPGDVIGGVVGRALALTGAGAVVGVAGALAATRLLGTLLFGVSRADPVSYVAGILVLCVVAVLAAWAPARRAARVDPTIALRAE